MAATRIRIGTRKSVMALAQTEEIARRLTAAVPDLDVEIVKFETTGDTDQTSKLLPHGGKGGAFVARNPRGRCCGRTACRDAFAQGHAGQRRHAGACDRRDAVARSARRRAGAAPGRFDSRISGGRAARVSRSAPTPCAARPMRGGCFREIEVIHYRGAADTRVRKLDNREMQRLAGWRRGRPGGCADHGALRARARRAWPTASPMNSRSREMLPAVGQGIVAVECAAQDWQTRRILSLIDDPAAHRSADAEREVLWVLNGHCNSPIAGFSTIEGDADVADRFGAGRSRRQLFIEASRTGPADRPRELGRAVGLELLAKGAAAIIERSRPVVMHRHHPRGG